MKIKGMCMHMQKNLFFFIIYLLICREMYVSVNVVCVKKEGENCETDIGQTYLHIYLRGFLAFRPVLYYGLGT